MLESKEKQELNVTNVLSYRGKIKQAEREKIGKEMESYIQNAGAKRLGNPITATYAVEGNELDIDVYKRQGQCRLSARHRRQTLQEIHKEAFEGRTC